MATEQQLEQYRTEGYFIADDGVAPEMLEELREALGRCERKVRAGAVVDDSERIRLDGDPVEALSHIRALLAPEFGEPVFAEYLESAPVLRCVNPLLGEELRLGWVSALVVDDRPYWTGWHRDIGREERDGSYEVEMEILGRYRKNLVKWHLALIDDPCLWLVPGSHRRYRTGEEREFLVGGAAGELSTGKQILLKQGQTIFWTGNTIHRGLMPEGVKRRMTLTAGLARYDAGDPPEELDERYRWMLADAVGDSLPAGTRRFYDNWRAAVRA